MSTPVSPTYTGYSAAAAYPGLTTGSAASSPEDGARGSSDEQEKVELLGGEPKLPGADRVDLSEAGKELLGAARGLPGERTASTGTAEDEERPPSLPSRERSLGADPGPPPTGVEASGKDSDSTPEVGHRHTPGDEYAADGLEAAPSEEEKPGAGVGATGLDPKEEAEVDRLEERDREVRTHEQAHAAAGGQHVRGGIQFEYATGPDGRRYAVGGEVSIDTSPVSGDPQGTILKAQAIRRAALAPAQPSSADRSVAAAASRMEAEARRELLEQQTDEATSGSDEASAVEASDVEVPVAEASASEDSTQAAAAGASAEIPEPGLSGPEPLSEQPTPLEAISGILVSTEPKGSDDDDGGLSALRDEVEKGLPEASASTGGAAPPVMQLSYGPAEIPGGLLDLQA